MRIQGDLDEENTRQTYVERLWEKYRIDPTSVSQEWRNYFERIPQSLPPDHDEGKPTVNH